MKVKITRAGEPHLWYSRNVGKIIEVVEPEPGDVDYQEFDNDRYVPRDCCEVITGEPAELPSIESMIGRVRVIKDLMVMMAISPAEYLEKMNGIRKECGMKEIDPREMLETIKGRM